jgi:glycerol-3-phosphate acyltransferase PlsX
MKIALDAMGGDHAPANPVLGAVLALREFSDIELILVGDQSRLEEELAKHSCSDVRSRITFLHASQVVDMTDGAVQSVRRKKDSSISRAIDLAKEGVVDAVVSAGHTGAAVAAATIKLRTLPGIERPAIATVMPTETNLYVLIDAGANIEVKPSQLVEFAIMGSVYSQEILGYAKPRVGLLSIGSEDVKGSDFTKEAFKLLKSAPVHFVGNVEGHDLFLDPVEVVVCDGFLGNVVLKTSESLAKAIFGWLKTELKRSPIRMLGAWLARGAFYAIKKKTDADEYGGMPLLGINGILMKAHGSASSIAIKNAIRNARNAVTAQVNPRIVAELEKYQQAQAVTPENVA